MGKTKHKYNDEDDYALDGEAGSRIEPDRIKQKRIERALKTKNIKELMDLEDQGIDPDDDDYWFHESMR